MSVWSRIAAFFLSRPPAPAPSPIPPVPPVLEMHVSVWEATGGFAAVDHAELQFDDPTWPVLAAALVDGRLQFLLPPGTRYGWQVHLTVTAGQRTEVHHVALAADVDVVLTPVAPPAPPVEPLNVSGRYLTTRGGGIFHWFGVTAFRLLELVATGREAEAIAFLDWCALERVRIVRVLAMAKNLFVLDPAAGVAALPRLLALAGERGLRVEVVALADTKSFIFDPVMHIEAIGHICGLAGNAVIEIGNEVLPVHDTQMRELGELGVLERLGGIVPPSVPVSLGSTHADHDEDPTLAASDFSDYATGHMSRSMDDNGWKWVRHTNELGAIADNARIYEVDDEPMREDLTPGKHLALAFLCRAIRTIGHTFHYKGGLQALVPVGAELEAFRACRDGFELVPADFVGRYVNAGQTGGPVKGFTGALRAYSGVLGGLAYTLALDADNVAIEWNDGWRPQLLVSRDGAKVWRVTR